MLTMTETADQQCRQKKREISYTAIILETKTSYSTNSDQTSTSKQASLFAKNNIMTILIQNVNNTMAGYQKEILPSSWSPILKYSVIILTVRRKKR